MASRGPANENTISYRKRDPPLCESRATHRSVPMRSLFVVAALLAFAAPAAAQDKPKVYVLLWFDTEDYVLPASDDAALDVAAYLTKQGIRATFKVVGHKARTLEARKRKDVIE